MKIHDKILRVKDRDIIKVEIREGYSQGFYRSTGRNSHHKGVWYPLDGIVHYQEQPTWFDKKGYIVLRENRVEGDLHRYGTEELKTVSDELGTMEIPEGVETKCSEVNEWLGYPKPIDKPQKVCNTLNMKEKAQELLDKLNNEWYIEDDSEPTWGSWACDFFNDDLVPFLETLTED